ncbi:general substrate transporter [Diaporthe sp. PMI_573]|nr:general substrate transporter [Diaporthaceae sp. PMI_573]
MMQPDNKANSLAHLETIDDGTSPMAIDKPFSEGVEVQMRSTLDDLPILKAVRIYWRVAAICMMAAFNAALEGYQLALTNSIVSNKGFIRTMSGGGTKLNPTYISVWGGMLSTGQFVGVGLLQLITDKIGRKKAMHITWMSLVVSVALESAATNWIYWLFARLIGGAGLGTMQATYPVYISENAPTQIRGFLTTSYMFWYVCSQIFAPLALRQLAFIDPYNFKIPIYTQWGMLGGMLLINTFLLPESPWWLVQKNKLDEAEKVLAKTHKGVPGYDVKSELSIIVATIERERQYEAEDTNQYKQIFQGTNLWRLFICFWPKAMQQLTGQSVTNNYGTYFFQLAGNNEPFTVTVILAVCQLVGVLSTSLFSDGFGRRWLTLGLFGSGAIAILAIGILGSFNYENEQLGDVLVFWACVSNFGVIGGASIAYSYIAEIPNQRLRARTASIALMGSFVLGIAFNYTVPLMLDVWSVRTGYFFGATGTISCIIGYFVLPEITCRTPAEIDEMFRDKIAPRKFRKHVTQVQLFVEAEESRQAVDTKDQV